MTVSEFEWTEILRLKTKRAMDSGKSKGEVFGQNIKTVIWWISCRYMLSSAQNGM